MPSRFLFLAAGLLATDIAAFAETLRVPQDYPLIQRAAWAAAPGDTIVIAEGTFFENVVVAKPLTIQGAGTGKTILAGKDRASAIITLMGKGGAISAANFTVRHEPAVDLPVDPNSTEPPIVDMSEALSISDGELSLKNIVVENSSGQGASVSSGKATVDNLTIVTPESGGLNLFETLPGTVVSNVSVRDAKTGIDITAYEAAGELKKLQLTGKGGGFIRVEGPKSAITFPSLAADLKDKIEWGNGVSADGVPPKPAEGEEAPADEQSMDPYSADRQARRDEHQLNSEPARRQLARDLQVSLKDKKSAQDYAAALGIYFKSLLETYQPGETADFGVDRAITGEIRAFYERFGAQATKDAIPTWPKFTDFNEGMIQTSYDWSLTRVMRAGIEEARGADWVKDNSAKLDEFFAVWKNEKSKEPAVLAAAFLRGLRSTGELLYSGEFPPENLKGALRERSLKEANAFITQAGYPALVQLLKQIAADQNNDIFTAPELQAALTPEQKRELFKAMRGAAK